MWAVLTVVVIVALLIPIVAILVDSPLGRAWARRFEGGGASGGGGGAGGREVSQLKEKVELLEGEVEELHRSLSSMREEVQFVQRLLEKPAPRSAGPKPPPAAGAA